MAHSRTQFTCARPGRHFRNLPCRVVLLAALVAARPCFAEQASQAMAATRSTPQHVPPTAAAQTSLDRKSSWQLFGSNLLRSHKKIWLFPIGVAKGHHVKPTLALVGITATLVGLDQLTARELTGPRAPNSFNRVFSGENTYLGTTAVLPALYLTGLFDRDGDTQHTAL